MNEKTWLWAPVLLVLSAVAAQPVVGQTASPAAPSEQTYSQVVGEAVSFLRRVQAEDGSYSAEVGPGITALVATSLLKQGVPDRDPVVAQALAYLDGFFQSDGGIYREGSVHRNYETALTVMCLSELTSEQTRARYEPRIAAARKFLEGIQWDESEDKDPSSPAYGGAGYGGHKRPDLSNTSFMIDALRAAGAPEDDPAIQKALIFVSRCQNLESEHNMLPFPSKNPDGGFYYTCAAGGTSQAGTTPQGGLRSYGSMTYAGLKSMLFAGVDQDDPRVKAAVAWIRDHYDLTQNPGMGPQMEKAGLYYYYHTFAKALHAMGTDKLTVASGETHDWRTDLLQQLAKSQQENGSWVNENPRWMEGDASLATGYALLSLSYCRPDSLQ